MHVRQLIVRISKVTLSPVLHVNADDAEAVVHDVVCFRLSEWNLVETFSSIY